MDRTGTEGYDRAGDGWAEDDWLARRMGGWPVGGSGDAHGAGRERLDDPTPPTHRPHGREMPLNAKLRKRLEEVLKVVDDHGTVGPRLADDAARLWGRVRQLLDLGLLPAPWGGPERDALELACFALQLPLRHPRPPAPGRVRRATLRDRCEEAAELLLLELGALVGEGLLAPGLLDRATRILRETPHRSPVLDEAKLLADALNLEDFGLTGVVRHAMQLPGLGQGLAQLADGLAKRDEYGYWDARLNDGFHFAPVRDLALRRLDHARQAAALLRAEMEEDGAWPPAGNP